jgi:uncharacterized membrane protein
MKKKWYQSKIVWVNIINAILEIAQLVSGLNLIPPGILSLITNGLTIVLRQFFTNPIPETQNNG